MLTPAQLLEPLRRLRTNEVVVTTMSVVRPWGRISDHDLDFASADSAMGHAADLALGIALARPERRVVCLNGDGSMLMSLGTLATIVGARASNLVLFVVDNGGFEITGGQPVAGAHEVDYAGLALAAGFPTAVSFHDPRTYAQSLGAVLEMPGPVLVHVRVSPGGQGPIVRNEDEDAPYLRVSLAESARTVRAALRGEG